MPKLLPWARDRLEQAMLQLGVGREKLAYRLGIEQSTLGHFMRGEFAISPEVGEELAKAF